MLLPATQNPSGLPRSTIQPLQRVMNTAPRVMALSTRDNVKSALKQLQWLPVEQRISYTNYALCLHDLFIRE